MGMEWFSADTLKNLLTGLGVSGQDKNVANQYTFCPLTKEQLDAAYRGDWVARKCVDIPPQDATREWRSWQADKDTITKIEDEEKRLGVQQKVKQAMIRGRLYGGGALLMGDGSGDPSQPLEIDRVKQGGLKYLHVLSCFELTAGELERDPESEWFGEPKDYTIATSMMQPQGLRLQSRIHPSRVIRFLGAELPDMDLASFQGQGWSDPILQIVDDAVKNVSLVSSAVAQLVHESKLDVIKLPDLAEQVSTAEYRTRLQNRFSLMSVMKSIYGVNLMDANDEWSRIEQNFTGLPDIAKLYLTIACGAVDVPATRFLSQSPQGMNATGDSDTRNYYDRISSDQETDLSPRIKRLDDVLVRSALGGEPDDLWYEWDPLWQMTDAEKATIGYQKAQAFQIDVNTGLILDDALRVGRQNQLIEDGTYPGFEQAIDDAEKAQEQALGEMDPEVRAQHEQLMLAQKAGLPALPPPAAPGAAPAGGTGAPGAEGGAPVPKPGQRPPTGDAWGYGVRRKKRRRMLGFDATPKPLYVRRDLVNRGDLIAWAKAQGITIDKPDELHVTVLFSRQSVDWIKMGEAGGWSEPSDQERKLYDVPEGGMIVRPGGPRVVETFQPSGATALQFASTALCYRHEDMVCRGASHDWEDYIPHITLNGLGQDAAARTGVELAAGVEPYRGALVFGPEIFEDLKPS